MQTDSRSRQLILFPDQLLTWETLSDEVQHSLNELFSLLLQQALDWQTAEQKQETDWENQDD